jgi:hypothetical protein
MYYRPELIPGEFIQPHATKGIIYAQSELAESGGVNAEHYNALHEGGARNGVLTAIEDFVAAHKNEYVFFHVEEEYGLGIMFRKGRAGASLSFNRWRNQTRYFQLRAKLHEAMSKLVGR